MKLKLKHMVKKVVIVRKKIVSTKFTLRLSQEFAQAVNIYCKTVEIKPKKFIRDAIVKDLIRTYVDLQREDYIYLSDKFPKVKKPLKEYLESMKLTFEITE